jgi:hypothetical protein
MPFSEETCPYCGNARCTAEWCDIGVGFTQIAPYHCDVCQATEIGAYDKTVPTAVEAATGGYAPGRLPDTVSSVNGCLIDTKTALRRYEAGVVPSLPCRLDIDDTKLVGLLGFRVAKTVGAEAPAPA